MSASTSYTEIELATYMDNILGAVADALVWTVAAGNYDESVNSAVLTYGADDIADITGRTAVEKLRAIARVEAWRSVAYETAGHYDFSDGGVSLHRSQMHAQAVKSQQMAEADAMQFGFYGNEAIIDTIEYVHDPYRYFDDDDRVIAP